MKTQAPASHRLQMPPALDVSTACMGKARQAIRVERTIADGQMDSCTTSCLTRKGLEPVWSERGRKARQIDHSGGVEQLREIKNAQAEFR
jgi:hypothetical protein